MNEPKFTLIGDWSKPVNTLIEKCSDVVGGLFAPHQIRRIARANADADKTQAIAKIEITSLQRRAARRWIVEEGKKQANMESIVRKALPDVKEDARPGEIDDDWVANFFDKCRLISDDQMQTLWGRILAGEANAPRRFSKKTVNLVGNLDKGDAAMFSDLCRFVVNIGSPTLVVLDSSNPIYTNAGVTFGALLHLAYTGLIQFNGMSHFVSPFAVICPEKTTRMTYFDQPLTATFTKDEPPFELTVGHAVLTQAGSQLVPLCDAKPCDGFVPFAKARLVRHGITLLEA